MQDHLGQGVAVQKAKPFDMHFRLKEVRVPEPNSRNRDRFCFPGHFNGTLDALGPRGRLERSDVGLLRVRVSICQRHEPVVVERPGSIDLQQT